MIKFTKSILPFVIVLLSFAFFSCSDDSDSSSARFQVRLTDAPADYEEVNINIQDILINATNNENGGWVSLGNVKKGVYNLLDLTGGLDTLLADVELPAGKVNQIRLVLGDSNSVKVDGVIEKLTTPSAQTSGLKLSVNMTLEEGVTYKILLDFDAGRSIIKTENSSKYNLKPVIRTIVEAQSGSIIGSTSPATFTSYAYAISGTDTLSAFTNEVGKFVIKGVKAGTYKVVVQPSTESDYLTKEIPNVTVVNGQATNLNTIQLSPQ
jgi:hypothetical protein